MDSRHSRTTSKKNSVLMQSLKILDMLVIYNLCLSSEKAAVSQLLKDCVDNAFLPTNQLSYRQFHSTETSLLKVQNDILMNMDR